MNCKRFIYTGALVLAIGFSLLLTETQAAAHRLNVFAWLKGDEVVVECNFGEHRPAKNTLVTILDSTNQKRLLQGHANAQGVFTFRVPQVVREGHGLTIDADAGEGHHNVWHMDASELYEAASLTAGFEEAALEGKSGGKQPNQPPAGSVADTPATAIAPALPGSAASIPLPQAGATPDHVRAIVREELENHMAPISRSLAQATNNGPTFVEIIGGIGWIIGIIGIVLYFRSRRPTN